MRFVSFTEYCNVRFALYIRLLYVYKSYFDLGQLFVAMQDRKS